MGVSNGLIPGPGPFAYFFEAPIDLSPGRHAPPRPRLERKKTRAKVIQDRHNGVHSGVTKCATMGNSVPSGALSIGCIKMSDELAFMTPSPLKRGGMLVLTSLGPVQFAAPPETIKDTIPTSHGVANIFVLTPTFFDYERGVSLAETEFPAYFNFFVKQKKVCLVCTAAQEERVRRIMHESLFGPEHIDLEAEIPTTVEDRSWQPDLEAELAHFRKSPIVGGRAMVLEDLVQFCLFDEDTGIATLDGVTITLEEDGRFKIVDEDSGQQAFIAPNLSVPSKHLLDEEDVAPFRAPEFGVTILGSGHGFDPHGKTTGFLLWVGGRGILVDPPVDTAEWLQNNGIPGRAIDSIILTHCHTDHDGGTLQKILRADKERLYTTQTVYDSFLRKSSAITDLAPERFDAILDFCPVPIHQPYRIHGGAFVFEYTLHSIPTIRFEVFYGGKSIVYSSDTLYDPESIENLREQGVLSKGRAKALIDFPWHHDLVIHEAGVPPIHTSCDILRQLPDDVKKRMVLVHTTASAIPPDCGLKLASMGAEGTLRLDVSENSQSRTIRWLKAFQAIDYFRDLSMGKAVQMLELASERLYKAGEPIIRVGEPGFAYYVILSGKCVITGGEVPRKVFGMHQYFGESSLINNTLRTANVTALTDTVLLQIEKNDFLAFIEDSDIRERMKHLSANRRDGTWKLMDLHPVLSGLNSAQRSELQTLMMRHEFGEGELVSCSDDQVAPAFFIASGCVMERTLDGVPKEYGPGEFTASLPAIADDRSPTAMLRAAGPTVAYRLERIGLKNFLLRYPGVYLRLLHHRSETGIEAE
jgi:CRP-like cAMP-binding protein/phosphoribosyl 1,2-cyclic phosphodiesterase